MRQNKKKVVEMDGRDGREKCANNLNKNNAQ